MIKTNKMLNLSIVGSSKIVDSHIAAAKANNFKIYSIYSTRKNSKNLIKLQKKYKIKKKFNNFNDFFLDAKKKDKLAFLVAPRIKDNIKILTKILTLNKYVLTEKPVTTNLKDFKKLIKFKNKIFVGYNRIFYENIKYLKKNLKSPANVIVKCPEINKKKILTNSVHILSVLFYLFGKLKIYKKVKTKTVISLFLYTKKKLSINIFFNIKFPENFSISIYEKKSIYKLKPIEKLNVFKKLKKNKKLEQKRIVKYFEPISSYQIDEFKNNKYKPGFYYQWKNYKKFIQKKIKKPINDIFFAKSILSMALKIL